MKDHPINPDGPRRPALLVFDVNETLCDISPLAARSEDVRAPGHLAQTWFAELEGQSRNDAMDFIDGILAIAVWPLVTANVIGLVLLWLAVRGRRKEDVA